jgi:formylglycine-generating enzyme required for sulfatase activity
MSHSYPKHAFLGLLLLLTTHPAAATENSIGMKLVRIPAGKFTMGSPLGEKDRLDHENQHEVEIRLPCGLKDRVSQRR